VKIGYSVEGSTDRAFIRGLRDRWCPGAELEEGFFRGSTGFSRRRECERICSQFVLSGVDVIVVLTDGNGSDWRQVKENERQSFPEDHLFQCVHGVPDRNIECWICADPVWLGSKLGVEPDSLRTQDPKGTFEAALKITRDEKQEGTIAKLVADAPLQMWLEQSRTFQDFYDRVRAISLLLGCEIENLRDNNGG
jgi:hypothetical protein